MAIWRKPLQFINVMLANRSPMSVAERGPGRMTYAKKKKNPLQNMTCASRLSAQVKTCCFKGVCLGTRQDEMINST